MMEYRFRGWDVIGQRWVYGDLVHDKKVTRTGLEPRTMVGGYEVDPRSVGIYSGWKDVYGTDVYEGDVIRDGWDLDNEVVWDERSAGLYLVCDGIYSTFLDVEFATFKIVGNRYEDSNKQ